MVSHVFYGTIQTESPADSLNREQAKAGRAPQTSSSVMATLRSMKWYSMTASGIPLS